MVWVIIHEGIGDHLINLPVVKTVSSFLTFTVLKFKIQSYTYLGDDVFYVLPSLYVNPTYIQRNQYVFTSYTLFIEMKNISHLILSSFPTSYNTEGQE